MSSSAVQPSSKQTLQLDHGGYFLLTVDVEDWFQVENLRPWNPLHVWDRRELRVEGNTRRILDLLDSVSGNRPHLSSEGKACVRRGQSQSETCQNRSGLSGITGNPALASPSSTNPEAAVTATFFVLGWIAKRLPNLVREIAARGHEVASHGYSHKMCTNLHGKELGQDLDRSKKLLEDILGAPVSGYRAPNFSVTPRILEAIRASGYRYDSSYNSFSWNPRYGQLDFPDQPRLGSAFKIGSDFYEIPISNMRLMGRVFPLGGGGYFRLFPWSFFRAGIERILKYEGTYMFYFHPWEIDPLQPRLNRGWKTALFKHYVNLSRTEDRLHSMLRSFSKCRFLSCSQYLSCVQRDNLV